MIRRATVGDIPQLKRIWETCYNDPLNYIEFLYEHITTPERTYVFEEEEGGLVTSMAVTIDCFFSFRETRLPSVYLFGCATLPDHEGQGYMTRLLSRMEADARSDGKQLVCLIPGGRFLSKFYQKKGYHSDFGIRLLRLRPGMLGDVPEPDIPIQYGKITSEEFYAIREAALYEIPHIEWDAHQLGLVQLDLAAYGEQMVSYDGASGKSYAIYGLRNHNMFIREVLGTNDESTRILLAELINQQNPRKVSMRMPIGAGLLPFEGTRTEYGMSKIFNTAKPLSDLAPFMNLMLD